MENELLLKLRRQAQARGVSEQEEHHRILTEALKDVSLTAEEKRRPSLIEFLMSEGEPWPDEFLPPRSKSTDEH